ncbi:hypothetical protein Sjap_009990 [Stephania japonica]|uniref:Uncharacterized protein n=1 Tax=Stephania japonica TaxID=461633 RepID=A0AAP0P3U8_9MAGN
MRMGEMLEELKSLSCAIDEKNSDPNNQTDIEEILIAAKHVEDMTKKLKQ